MVFKRKIYDKFLEWKNTSLGKSALLVEGARRIGKSTIVEEFAKNEYKSYILIDFTKVPKSIASLFEDVSDLDYIFLQLQLIYKTDLYKRESLIIFDEVQFCPKARQAIKHLVADNRYDYIETGSLISIKKNVKNILIPSEEKRISMFPMDYEEFRWALGDTTTIPLLKKLWEEKKSFGNDLNRQLIKDFRLYMLVGGMPQSVVAYLENALDFEKSDIEKRDILELYRNDIKKSAKRYNSKVSAIFENIPAYLSTHEKKIVLSEIDKNTTFDKYDEPLFWLDDSMICNLCYKCNDPCVGFALNKNESSVKCYMGDTGLLVSLAFSENEIANEQLYKSIMNGKLSLNEGMLYENVIAQMLVSKGRKLYFYTQYNLEKRRNDIEIDFLLSNESKTNFKIFPLEVKSSKNYTTTSLTKFAEKFGNKIENQIIVHPKQFTFENGIMKIPPYMIPCL